MKIGGIIVLCVLVLLLVVFMAIIRVFNKLSLKKMGTEVAYMKIDDLFITRYELLAEVFAGCKNTEGVSSERELAINATTAEERVEHDKKMAEELKKLTAENAEFFGGEGAEFSAKLGELEVEISEAYAEYNKAVDAYTEMRNKKYAKPVVRFFKFEEKPIF